LDFSAVMEIDWEKLAAYIDGEGSINMCRRAGQRGNSRSSIYIRIHLVNTDIRLVGWILDTFGVGAVAVHCKRIKAQHKQTWRWIATCRQAEAVLQHCFPYFIVKQEEAAIALEFQETLRGAGTLVSADMHAHRENLRLRLCQLHADTGRLNPAPTPFLGPRKTGPKPHPLIQ